MDETKDRVKQSLRQTSRVAIFKVGDRTFRIHKNRITMGRVTSADLVLESEGIAPIHCVLEVSPDPVAGLGDATLYDLASESGTKVNGKKIVTQTIKSGDEIQIGKTKVFFELESLDAEIGNLIQERTESRSLFYEDNSTTHEWKSRLVSGEIEEIFEYPSATEKALQVVLAWKDAILDVQHFHHSYSVSIGTSPNADFLVPMSTGEESYVLMEGGLGGFELHLPTEARGVYYEGSQLLNLKDFSSNKRSFEIDDYAKLRIGELDLYLSYVPAPPELIKQTFFELDPSFARVLIGSMSFSLLLLILALRWEIPEPELPEELPPRVATVIYQPEKYNYFSRKEKSDRSSLDEPKPIEQKPLEAIGSKDGPVAKKSASQSNRPKGGNTKRKDGASVAQRKGKEGAGARAEGVSGKRGSKKVRSAERAQNQASRPGKNPGKGRGGSRSQQADNGNIDLIKNAGSKISKIFGGSAQLFERKGSKVKGYGAFSSEGEGGLALSGKGTGGGGNSKIAQGLANKGRGGGRVGTGLGAVGKGDNVIGGKYRVALRGGSPEESVVLGAIDKDAVERALLRHRDEFRLCYEREINQGSPNIAGRVNTSFEIGARGRSSRTQVVSTSLNNARTERCILKVIRKIQFPRPRGGGKVTVKYPFKFRPVGS